MAEIRSNNREGVSKILARSWGVFAQPISNEERVIAALERVFSRSEWVEEPAPEVRPPAASTLSVPIGRDTDPLPPGGPGAVVFIGGGNWDKRKLVNWVKKQPAGTVIRTGPGRITKDGKPMDAEGHLKQVAEDFGLELEVPAFPHHEGWYGKRAKEIEVYDLLDNSAEIILCGSGGRVAAARKWRENPDFAKHRTQPVVEIQ